MDKNAIYKIKALCYNKEEGERMKIHLGKRDARRLAHVFKKQYGAKPLKE